MKINDFLSSIYPLRLEISDGDEEDSKRPSDNLQVNPDDDDEDGGNVTPLPSTVTVQDPEGKKKTAQQMKTGDKKPKLTVFICGKVNILPPKSDEGGGSKLGSMSVFSAHRIELFQRNYSNFNSN